MSVPEIRRSPTNQIDDVQLLQGLLTQRLYVPEPDRQLLRVLLAEAPRQQPAVQRAARRRSRRLRAAGAALAVSGALALALASPLMPTVAASSAPASWVSVADHPAGNLASPADDVLLRALLNHAASSNVAAAPADQSDVLLRAMLNHSASSNVAAAPADQSDVLLRAMLNSSTANVAAAPAEQSDVLLRAMLNTTSEAIAPAQADATLAQADPALAQADATLAQIDPALAQAELAVGETLVIPAAVANSTSADPNYAPLADTVYVVQPGDTLSGIAWAFYGNGNNWWGIFQANAGQIANPHWIYPNQRFVIPGAFQAMSVGTNTYIDWKPNLNPNVKKGTPYTVVWGDTLSQLALVAYGNGNDWPRIFYANTDKIANPNLIYPGQVFTIPL